MTTSMGGVKAFLKGVLSKKPWNYDPLVIRKQWNEDEYHLSDYDGGKRLCFAVLWDDGVTMPHPPILRGLEATKQALIQAGHKGTCYLWTLIVTLKGHISDRLETNSPSRDICTCCMCPYGDNDCAGWHPHCRHKFGVLSGMPIIRLWLSCPGNPSSARCQWALRISMRHLNALCIAHLRSTWPHSNIGMSMSDSKSWGRNIWSIGSKRLPLQEPRDQ